jgi:hypothetical protein
MFSDLNRRSIDEKNYQRATVVAIPHRIVRRKIYRPDSILPDIYLVMNGYKLLPTS